ncbi:SLAP domain-containing protein [Lactobacillus sp. ESL0791]|uniref:SLAP domain-containing protein n=1 Tax=Lactobacillus sp. ESL0791 TaxID=2983234 RepID=UPI0023F90E47|nr:SLAP domain-containing protein [Lactobacillus sp. ESL0791]MDF7638454.1 SLAP domain-containing protein [Lactobacillus sp. ESL0791]
MKRNKKLFTLLTAAILTVPSSFLVTSNVQVRAAKSQKGTFKINMGETYLYDKNGHIYKKYGKLGKLPTQIDNKDLLELQTDKALKYYGYRTIKGERYLNVGNNGYVKLADVNVLNGKNIQRGKLVLDHNSRVYNKNGRKKAQVLAKGAFVKYAGKVAPISEAKDYYTAEWGISKDAEGVHVATRAWLPYRMIKGQDYYSLGKNRYIKAGNVKYIDGISLYTNKAITVTATQNLKIYRGPLNYSNSDDGNFFNPTDQVIRKGSKFKIDRNLYVTNEDPDDYYRLAGKDEYVDGDANANGATDKLEVSAYEDLSETRVGYKTNAKIYNAKGTALYPELYIDSLKNNHMAKVNEAVYLWVPSEQKAELFYQLDKQSYDLTSSPTPTKETASSQDTNKQVVDGYIKASDVEYASGPYLQPINSAQDAEKERVTATKSDRQNLENLISAGAAVEKSEKYLLSGGTLRANYDSALATAKQVIAAEDSSVGEVNLANAELTAAGKALNGQKVPVKNLAKLTQNEGFSVGHLASRAFEGGKYPEYVVNFNLKKNKLILTEIAKDASGKYQDIPHELNIADYAVEEK